MLSRQNLPSGLFSKLTPSRSPSILAGLAVFLPQSQVAIFSGRKHGGVSMDKANCQRSFTE